MRRGAGLGIVVIVLFAAVSPSQAVTQFKNAFLDRYASASDQPDYQRMVRKARCYLCHVKGEKKEVCNAYGEALAQLIEGSANQRLKTAKKEDRYDEELARVLEELDAAFEKVAEQTNAQGETYGDRIRAGRLPVPLAPADDSPRR